MHTHAVALVFVVALVAACAGSQAGTEALDRRVRALEAGGGSCNEETQKKLDYLISKVEGLEKRVAKSPPTTADHRRPDPLAVYSIDLTGAAITGPPTAPVTIVMAYEFACPYCYRVQETLAQLLSQYPGQIRIARMSYVVHPTMATLPAQAACAAQLQGSYEAYARMLWSKGFPNVQSGGYSEENLLADAKEVHLDLPRFKKDMAGEACKAQLAEQQRRLAAAGVTGTPAFYINGRFLSGARPIDQFKTLIDEELKKASDRIGKDGITAANYYDKVVLEGGVKKF
jgi:protein-disulfide isomerase